MWSSWGKANFGFRVDLRWESRQQHWNETESNARRRLRCHSAESLERMTATIMKMQKNRSKL